MRWEFAYFSMQPRLDNFHDKNHENIGYNYYTKRLCPLARRWRFYLLLSPI